MHVPKLYCHDGDGYADIPAWATSLLQLGINIGECERPGTHRSVVALALPTRAYAAALVATGISIAKAHIPVRGQDSAAHFLQLCELPPGTKVFYLDRERRQKALLDGTQHYGVDTYVRVQVTTGDRLTHLVKEADSGRIELCEWEGALPRKQKGQKFVRSLGFLEAVLKERLAQEFVTQSRLDVAIVGSVSKLRGEIADTPFFATLANGTQVEGTLQDLMRVRRLNPNQPYRCDLYSEPTRADEAPGKYQSTVALYDGCQAFLRGRDSCKQSHLVVVLDRTSGAFQDAVAALNESFMKHHVGSDPQPLLESRICWGAEVMVYHERTQ